ncbi:uncharacterized protein N7500_002028 [Penicillium coprophilum]|uniref:uncharacterized protein n=1 Tax=Penicillium coprophilum TaxID=36646 RepID=UPI0023886844|nr:uncharacterized protein N7500_002028 [Penicillium coprophilum]KAJ5174097.1 hypothetical protein N7500_002028 [Penicillium coprophilum]
MPDSHENIPIVRYQGSPQLHWFLDWLHPEYLGYHNQGWDRPTLSDVDEKARVKLGSVWRARSRNR